MRNRYAVCRGRYGRPGLAAAFLLVSSIVISLFMAVPGHGIQMAGEAKRMTEEEVNSRKIVREGEALEVMQNKDLDPPIILHEPVKTIRKSAPLKITAIISDQSAVKSASLSYRTLGKHVYDRVDMIQQSDDLFTATIPDFIVIGDGVEYFITALDTAGNPPGHSGSKDHPHQAAFGQGSHAKKSGMVFLLLIAIILGITVVPRFTQKREPER